MRKKRRSSALDRYAIFSLSAIIIYTVVAIVYQFISKEELSSVLTTCFFAAFSGELFMLCMIKRLKLKGGTNDD